MPPLVSQGIFACRKTGFITIHATGQAPIPAAFSLFCWMLAVLTIAGHFSAAVASVTDSAGPVAPAASQAPAQPADIPDLLQKLLDQNAQIRSAASQSLYIISPEIKIPALTKVLSDPNWKIQVVAAYHLGLMGPQARSAIPALTSVLDSPNPDVRFVIAKALGKIGSAAAVPALVRALRDKDENVRLAAAEGLDNLGPDAQAALPVLQKALRDGNWFVRTHAAAAFVRLAARDKDMLPVLLKAVENPLQEIDVLTDTEKEYQFRRQHEIPAVVAIDTLAQIGPEVVSPLLASLKNRGLRDDPYLDNVTVAMLNIGSKAGDEQVVDLLLTMFTNATPNQFQTEKFLSCLAALGFKAILGISVTKFWNSKEKITPACIAALQDKAWHRRVLAVAVISRSDPRSEATPYLINALQDPDWQVRTTAAAALGSGFGSGRWREDYDTFIISTLQDDDWRVRQVAIGALTVPGPGIPILLELLHDKYHNVHLAAAMKMLEFGIASDLAETILLDTFRNHPNARTRLAALEALGRQGHPDVVIPAFIQALQDDNARIRTGSATILDSKASIDPQFLHDLADDKLVAVLNNALTDKDEDFRSWVINIMGRIRSPAAVAPLKNALVTANQSERRHIFYALHEIRANSVDMINNLSHPDWQERRLAAEQLGAVGGGLQNLADPDVQALLRALRDRHPNVRATAAAVLLENCVDVEFPNQGIYRAVADILSRNPSDLLASLNNGDLQARLATIYVLGRIGRLVQTAIPALRETLTDENWVIRYGAALSLSRINLREAAIVPVLAEIFRDPHRVALLEIDDIDRNHDEILALGKIGSTESIAVLIDLLRLRDEQCRYTYYQPRYNSPAALTLLNIGPNTIPALVAVLQNDNGRFLAAHTLSQMGPKAIIPLRAILRQPPPVDPALLTILQDKDADLRRSAVYALGQIALKNPAQKKVIIQTLTAIMSDQVEPEAIRWLAAAFLWKLGNDVEPFFTARNLPKPTLENCHYGGVYDPYFDLYAGRCLYHVGGYGGGGQELFLLVRDLLDKKTSPGATTTQPKPAGTGR